MEISVTGRHLDVGSALKSHIINRLTAAAEKFFSRATDALVTVTKENHLFKIDCTLNVGQGISLHSHGVQDDVYAAFDMAADRIEKQLRKYKERIKSHHGFHRRGEVSAQFAQSYVLARDTESGTAGDKTEDTAPVDPMIIAEARTELPHVSVGDAVQLMELADTQILMFRNAKNGQLRAVYHRPDGHIGWIESRESE